MIRKRSLLLIGTLAILAASVSATGGDDAADDRSMGRFGSNGSANRTNGDATFSEFFVEYATIAAGKRAVADVITTSASPTPDFDGDNHVGFSDFLIFASAFGSRKGDAKYNAAQDLNSDGSVDFTDFLIFAQSF